MRRLCSAIRLLAALAPLGLHPGALRGQEPGSELTVTLLTYETGG